MSPKQGIAFDLQQSNVYIHLIIGIVKNQSIRCIPIQIRYQIVK